MSDHVLPWKSRSNGVRDGVRSLKCLTAQTIMSWNSASVPTRYMILRKLTNFCDPQFTLVNSDSKNAYSTGQAQKRCIDTALGMQSQEQ